MTILKLNVKRAPKIEIDLDLQWIKIESKHRSVSKIKVVQQRKVHLESETEHFGNSVRNIFDFF